MQSGVLGPLLALITWTFVVEVWMYARRIPALRAAGIDPRRVKRKDDIAGLPVSVEQVADNYNHLHEQPTVFYALAICTHLLGAVDALDVGLAWAYVGLRVAHSLIQGTINFVPVRFVVFSASSLVLVGITARAIVALVAAP